MAYLAHQYLGNGFGTAYDLSTMAILWFAGASAMAGLLNLVPRYLPRYGMAPAWARAARPLVLVFAGIAFLITWIFDANVDAQARRLRDRRAGADLLGRVRGHPVRLPPPQPDDLGLRPDHAGLRGHHGGQHGGAAGRAQDRGLFHRRVLIVSFGSRVIRSSELRATSVSFDPAATRFLRAATPAGTINIIANEPDARDEAEYRDKLAEERAANRIPEQEPVMFLEVTVADASEFESELEVRGEDRFGHQVLTVRSTAVANAIAAITLDLRDRFAVVPHVYFDWTEGHPIANFLRFILWGSGEVAPVTREVLRRAEPDRARRPHIHVG